MSPKIRERVINIMINLLTASVMLSIFFLSRRDTVDAKVIEDIDSKAPYEYVDDRNAEIQDNFKDYKEVHQIQHDGTQALLKSMDSKIDILLTEK